MNPEQGNKTAIGLGKGSLLSVETARGLGRVAVSKNPATDWAKCRLVAMVFTVLILVWGLGGMFDLIVAGPGQGTGSRGPVAEGEENPSQGDGELSGRTHAKDRLRNDLFRVAKPKKKNNKKVPKTNPAELLRLLELQGVLGGDTPRAMVFYKRTKKTVTVSVGDDLGEFKVTEIRDRSVILKWREELFELSL